MSEFAAFAQAEMQLLIAEGHEEGALSWFRMWEELDPDHPQLEKWRPLLNTIPDDWVAKADKKGLNGRKLLEDLQATIKASNG